MADKRFVNVMAHSMESFMVVDQTSSGARIAHLIEFR